MMCVLNSRPGFGYERSPAIGAELPVRPAARRSRSLFRRMLSSGPSWWGVAIPIGIGSCYGFEPSTSGPDQQLGLTNAKLRHNSRNNAGPLIQVILQLGGKQFQARRLRHADLVALRTDLSEQAISAMRRTKPVDFLRGSPRHAHSGFDLRRGRRGRRGGLLT